MIKKLLTFMLLLTASMSLKAQQADAIVGTWMNSTGEAKIAIFKSGGNLYFGTIAWLRVPTDENGKEKLDKNNPDPKLRTKPIKGLMLLRSFKHAGNNVWEDGKIYDPKNGKDYSCKLTLTTPDKLEVRGYIGISLIGRTDNWTRVKN